MSSRTHADDDPTYSGETDRDRLPAETDETSQAGDGRTPPDSCPACGAEPRTDEKRGERVCPGCGLVVDETLLDRRPPRTDGDDDVTRTGPPTTPRFHDGGLGTVIADETARAAESASPRKLRRLRRLRTWNKRFLTRSSGERSLQVGLGELERMASSISAPDDVRETASVIFRKAHEAGLQLGRSIEATATAALFAALRREDVPVTLEDVTGRSRVDHEECERAYRHLLRELSLEIGPPDPTSHVSRIASALSADDAVERRARTLLEAAKDRGEHVGKHPVGQAAAAIYAAALVEDRELTQEAIASTADVSTPTIRKHYRTMLDAWRSGEA